MTAPKLLPCPFCGMALIEKHSGWFDHPKGKCILSGRAFHKGFIGQWNTRADRAEAEVRADQAARILIARASEGQDVLVLAHGYFNHMVGQKLKLHGWRLAENQGFKYWSQRRYEKR